jgi:hypothetical protein
VNWFKRKLSDWVVETHTRDLAQFLETLPRDARTLGAAAAAANDLRLRMLHGHGWDLRDPSVMRKSPKAMAELGAFIERLRKEGQDALAAVAMIWLHTIRATQWPELRPLALEMWQLIAEGFDHIEQVEEELFAATGRRHLLDDATVIPPVLFRLR